VVHAWPVCPRVSKHVRLSASDRELPMMTVLSSTQRARMNLLIRRFPSGRPDPFRTVRNLGLVSPGCPCRSGSSEGCSSVWLPAWLPARATLRHCLAVSRASVVHGSLPVSPRYRPRGGGCSSSPAASDGCDPPCRALRDACPSGPGRLRRRRAGHRPAPAVVLVPAPSPHRTDCCRPIRRRGGVKGRFACTLTSHFDRCSLPCGQIGP